MFFKIPPNPNHSVILFLSQIRANIPHSSRLVLLQSSQQLPAFQHICAASAPTGAPDVRSARISPRCRRFQRFQHQHKKKKKKNLRVWSWPACLAGVIGVKSYTPRRFFLVFYPELIKSCPIPVFPPQISRLSKPFIPLVPSRLVTINSIWAEICLKQKL